MAPDPGMAADNKTDRLPTYQRDSTEFRGPMKGNYLLDTRCAGRMASLARAAHRLSILSSRPGRFGFARGCKKQFTVKVGSSCEVARHLGITQKSAWFIKRPTFQRQFSLPRLIAVCQIRFLHSKFTCNASSTLVRSTPRTLTSTVYSTVRFASIQERKTHNLKAIAHLRNSS